MAAYLSGERDAILQHLPVYILIFGISGRILALILDKSNIIASVCNCFPRQFEQKMVSECLSSLKIGGNVEKMSFFPCQFLEHQR